MMLEPNKKPRMPEEEALEASLHTYLKALSERPVTPRNLVELERATKLTRQLLSVGQMQIATTGALEAGGNFIMSESLQNGANVGYDSYGLGGTIQAPLAQSSSAETFGASLVRELIASLKELTRPSELRAPAPFAITTQMSGSDLVYAIAMAREKGLSDLEGALIEKLLAMADKATDKTLEPTEETSAVSSLPVIENERGNGYPSTAPCGWCDRAIIDHALKNGEYTCQDGQIWKPKEGEVGAP